MEKSKNDYLDDIHTDDIRTTIDPQLLAQLETLRQTPQRDALAVQRGIARFENDIQSYLEAAQSNAPPVGNPVERLINQIKEIYFLFTQRNRIGLAIVIVVLTVLVILIGSTTATVSAAGSALPGDTLYRVKTGWEQTQVRITGDEYAKAQMYLQFSQRRLDEIARLIDEGRYADIGLAVDEFEFHIQQTIEVLGVLASNDPERAQELTGQLSEALSRYAMILTAMLSKVPESAINGLNRAITVTNQSLNGSPSFGGNNNDGLSNENNNDNSNDDDDGNMNTNSNDDDDSNMNTNSNDDDDDGNMNSNSNDEDDGNSNSNGDDDGNSNSNDDGNSNDDDDDGNSNPDDNDDDDDNSNSNGDDGDDDNDDD